jgi:hypothetical protein
MCGEYNKLRVEPDRIGLVIDACDSDAWLSALQVSDLTERVLEMAKCRSRMSPAGLILRQLVKRIGGLQGARAFKIPGVRRLIRTHGPTSSFTRDGAVQLIASRDLDASSPSFGSTDDLFIEGKRVGTDLTPGDVFGHLVAQGLFRIGIKLLCPACRLPSWVALDALKQQIVCELCGEGYDTTRQLVDSQWHYRRSGLLGHQTDAQGAIPVALTLQQLDTCLRAMSRGFYSPSLELEFEDQEGPCRCEVDFIWATQQRFTERTAILLAECKDLGPIDAADIDHLRRVADALPTNRFDAYVLLAKLAPFTPEEIENARKLNSNRRHRVILLTHRELEPYQVYARIKEQFHLRGYGSTPDDMAQTTATIYFSQTRPGSATSASTA